MRSSPRLFVIVGGPASGKDEVLRGIANMGTRHATIVPKHTTRSRRDGDGDELVFNDDPRFSLHKCDIVYEKHKEKYGIDTRKIWRGLKRGISQAIVASEENAIHNLLAKFGDLLVLIYIHSNIKMDDFEKRNVGSIDSYIENRIINYDEAFELYVHNLERFDHVLIYSEEVEDLYDQIFRLFRAYETRPSIGRLKKA